MVSYLTIEQAVIASSPNSECCCDNCVDPIPYGEPVVEILVGNLNNEGFSVLIDNNELVFEPLYLHLECWNSVEEELSKWFSDEPAQQTETSFLTCCLCGNGIELEETFGRALPGIMIRSPFCPNGEQADEFQAHSDGKNAHIICTSCLNLIHDEIEEDDDDNN